MERKLSKKSAKIAFSVLDAFKENSSYENYKESDADDGFKWSDNDYQKMLDELQVIVDGNTKRTP